ncbi:PASTA domain-containing protein [Microbispora siamensis]
MRRSVAISLITAIVAAFCAAVIATFALILADPGSTVSESALGVPVMPELRYQDVETARRAVTALGFVPEMHTLTGEEIKVPTDWIVVGQGPAPGTLLKSTMPIEFYVTRKDMPVPSPTTATP